MTPPIRIQAPQLGASLELAPNWPLPPHRLNIPQFAMAPWLPGPSTFRLPSVFLPRYPLQISESLPPPSAQATAPLRFADFLPALYGLADGIESMDLEVSNVPVNRGSGLCRYSEYSPRGERPADCSVTVYPNTRARVYGEIRPIRDSNESLITRFLVDFSPNVFNSAAINPLEIDGFGAVDAPDMSFDRSFSTRSPVRSMSGGDLNYENPFATHGAFATPFGQEAPAPAHRDFMIRFAPVETTVLSALQREVGANRLLLWAFLPTLGISDPGMFESLGIRFNTLPRRFSDLFRLFAPLFDRERRGALLQAAPYLNPNTEIQLDPAELSDLNAERASRREDPLVGLRQAIPSNRPELLRWSERRTRLNARRAEQGLPPLPPVTTNRGPVIDWVFSDLISDPQRLAALSDADMPSLQAHARLRETQLNLPMGRLGLQAGTEIHVRYALERVANPPAGQAAAQRVLEIRVEPVDVTSLDLEAGESHISADRLHASRLEIHLRMPIMLSGHPASPPSEVEVRLHGVEAENLGLAVPRFGLSTRLASARLNSLSVHRLPALGERVEVDGLNAQGAEISHPSMNLRLTNLSVPSLRVERGVTEDGSPGPLRIQVPDLDVSGIEGSGRVPIRGGSFHMHEGMIELNDGRTVVEGDLDLRGSFPNGFTEGPIALGNFTLSPAVEDLRVQGRARIEFSREGWRLSRSEGAEPLRIGFHIGPTWLNHRPELPGSLRGIAASQIIETRAEISSAEVQIEDLREVEFGQSQTAEGRRGRIRELHCGPISIHHLVGSGRIWVGLPIWGWVRGLFPELGGGPSGRAPRRPDFASLIRHLPAEAQALLGEGDFLRIGAVDLHRESGGAWQAELQDMIFSIRESGGRRQFGGLRIPRFTLRSRAPDTRTLFELDPNFWANIFLNDPDRGGSFRFVRWPERP